MMLCVPMFVGAQTLTFTDHEPMGKTMDESYEQMLQQLSNEGCTVRRLTHEEVSDFVTNVRQSEVQERWVKEKESEGTADVRCVFEKLRSLVQHSAKRKQYKTTVMNTELQKCMNGELYDCGRCTRQGD